MSTILSFFVLQAFCGVRLTLFLVEFEAGQGSHQGTNYSFKDCLVSSIFYGRYGMDGLSHTEAPHRSQRPSIQRQPCLVSRVPLFMSLIIIIIRLVWPCRAWSSYCHASGIYQIPALVLYLSFLFWLHDHFRDSSYICFLELVFNWIFFCYCSQYCFEKEQWQIPSFISASLCTK